MKNKLRHTTTVTLMRWYQNKRTLKSYPSNARTKNHEFIRQRGKEALSWQLVLCCGSLTSTSSFSPLFPYLIFI